jgi:L-lactate dehydrogenase complex protein LldG
VTTRADFLGRIRAEMRKVGVPGPAAPAERARHAEAAHAVRRQMSERWPEALVRFVEEFERVAGVFHRVPNAADVPDVIRGIAAERGAREIVTWEPAALGMDLGGGAVGGELAVLPAPGGADETARLRHRHEAARAGIGVTGADLAVAETGTLVLVSGAGRPRSTSLLPETHVAVFGPGALVESLEQVGVILEALHVEPARGMSGAVINFITGPSRTADIELTLTRGVHGPKHVHVVFVDGLGRPA